MIDIRQETKKAYLKKHTIVGDFKLSFVYAKEKEKFDIINDVIEMRIFCNDINILKNEDNKFIYEYCYNITKKYKKYRYCIYVKYNSNNYEYLYS